MSIDPASQDNEAPPARSPSDRYFLTSFAPSTGVGFYTRAESAYQFDLVTREEAVLPAGTGTFAKRFEFDQLEAGIYFDTKEAMLDFSIKEYLRDKKNTYYSALFTHRLSAELQSETLQILNSREFQNVVLSERLIPILVEIADPALVRAAMTQADELKLEHVIRCLARELEAITFRPDILAGPALTSLSGGQQSAEKLLRVLANYIESAGHIPQSAFAAITSILGLAERQFLSLGRVVARQVERIARIAQPETESLLLDVLSGEEFAAIEASYTAALLEGDLRGLRRLRGIVGEVKVTPDRELSRIGKRVLASFKAWRWRPRPYGFSLLLEPEGEWQELQPELLDMLQRHSGSSALRRLPSGVLFRLNFTADQRSLYEDAPWDPNRAFGTAAFFVALYADPEAAMSRLDLGYAFRRGPFRRGLLSDLDELLWYIDHIGPDVPFYYPWANVLSLVLSQPDDPDERLLVITDFLRHWSVRRRDVYPRDDLAILGNVLAVLFQTGLVDEAVRVAHRFEQVFQRKARLSPLLNFTL